MTGSLGIRADDPALLAYEPCTNTVGRDERIPISVEPGLSPARAAATDFTPYPTPPEADR